MSAAPPLIPLYVRVSTDLLLQTFNGLINDINSRIQQLSGITTNYVGAYAVASLPVSPAAYSVAFATDGLKLGETTGNGTGIPVYYSNGEWRSYATDATVES
jgi:hypothetical protein